MVGAAVLGEQADRLKYVYSGSEEGVGAAQSWEIDGKQRVTFTITKSVPNVLVEFDMELKGASMKSIGIIAMKETQDGVEVTYRDIWELGGNPLYRYLGLGFDRVVGPDLEKAAASLKLYCEGSK